MSNAYFKWTYIYLNCYPADTLVFLEELERRKDVQHGQNVYTMVQGGMSYIHIHERAFDAIKIFCETNDLVYKGGFVIGFGALLNEKEIDQHISAKKLTKSYHQFMENMAAGRETPRELYLSAETKIPYFLLRILTVFVNMGIMLDFVKAEVNYFKRPEHWNNK